jgi:hypothetical protein
MLIVSIAEAAEMLPALFERAQTESVYIRDKQGTEAMLIAVGSRSAAEREEAWRRADALSEHASKLLEESLAKDGITVEDFLADAFADD